MTPENAASQLNKVIKGSTPPVQSIQLHDLQPGESVISLVYGASGVGKTPFAGSAGSRVLYIDTGHGLETLLSPKFRYKYPNHNPYIVQIYEVFDAKGNPSAQAFDKIGDTIDWWLDNRYDDFDTIVVDEMSAARKMAMYKGLTVSSDTGRSKTKGTVEKYGGLIIPAIQDFGMEMAIVEWWVSTYSQVCKEAKKHLLVLAHERLTYDAPRNEKGDPIIGAVPIIKKIRPSFTGRTQPDDIVLYFDEVWYMEKIAQGADTFSRIKAYGDDQILAKTRHAGVFENIETNPDFLDFVKRIKEAQFKRPPR